MREKMLKKLAAQQAAHPWRVMAIVIFLTIIFIGFAEQLELTMRWSDLLPSGDKRTEQFNKVIDEFTSATSLVVVAQGEEPQIKAFADRLAPKIMELVYTTKNEKNQKQIEKIQITIEKLKTKKAADSKIEQLQIKTKALQDRIDLKLFKRVDYKNEVDFLKNHGLLLIKKEDLDNSKEIFMDPNIDGLLFNLNNSMEKEYVGREESISTREKEDQAVALLNGIENLVFALQDAARGKTLPQEKIQEVSDSLLIGDPYFLSYDKKALVMNAIPNFSMLDLDLVVSGTDMVHAAMNELLKDFPGVEAGLTGFIAIGRDEMHYSEKSLGVTSAIAVIAIMLLLMVSFRMWVAPLLAIGNLLVGLIWAVGLAALTVGQLNIMTQMFAVILMGLGIDFSIHIMSGFTEHRAAGKGILASLEQTYKKTGKGILTGGFTTAAAFLAMGISHSRGMKELGLVTGFGLLAILFSTMLFLPTLLVFRERRLEKRLDKNKDLKPRVQRDITFRLMGRSCSWRGKHYVFTLLVSVLVTVFFIVSGLKIKFDHNYMNIEPKGLTSIALQGTVMEKFDMSMDYALILTENPEESRKLGERTRDLGTVAMTEDISLYLPSAEQQEERLAQVREVLERLRSSPLKEDIKPNDIAAFNREVDRLQMNIMEIQDMAFLGGQDKVDAKCKAIVGDPDNPGSRNIMLELIELISLDEDLVSKGLSEFQKDFAPYFADSVIKMGSAGTIRLTDLPASVLDRYSNKNRDQFLVTVFPSSDVWKDAEFLKRFVADLEMASDKTTGMPPIFAALIQVIGRDGRNAMLLTLVVVFLLLWIDFRNPFHALIAMIPLAVGVFWMIGLMKLSGMMMTVMNVMGFPLILGIGIDDGVHIIHRWKQEGKGKIETIFSSTGKAIFLTSLTTMFAFGSLVFSIWRGFGQLGGALFLGVGACFLTTVIILPGIIGLIERKKN
ncbi:MAG: MMPL family transporter [Candidatus Aminicenantes bacterium]|nr:MMPL family transporter [Candidatus Aminicenantes bacterium]